MRTSTHTHKHTHKKGREREEKSVERQDLRAKEALAIVESGYKERRKT